MGLNKFNKYVFENVNVKELPLVLSTRFTKILKELNSKISNELLEVSATGVKLQFSYIDIIEDNVDFLSVLPANRINRIDGISEDDLVNPPDNSELWKGEKFRQFMRIGTFIARIMPKYAGSKDLENFVHEVKAKLDFDNYEIRVVRGEEIRKWYHVKTYYNPHPGLEDRPEEDGILDIRTPLMKSCLKQPEKQPFFDIYCDNIEQVGMVIMLNKEKKLVARAIVWFDCYVADVPENPTKGTLMDRIYYTNESDVNILINYAKDNGWFYKPTQAKEVFSYMVKGELVSKTITTRLKKNGVFDKYPYLDTMCFYTPETGRLSSSRGKPAINPKTGNVMERYQLQRGNGGTKRLSRDK